MNERITESVKLSNDSVLANRSGVFRDCGGWEHWVMEGACGGGTVMLMAVLPP